MPWTCVKCKTRWPSRNLLRCKNCGRKQPKKKKPAHTAVLEELTYEDFVRINGGEFCWICDYLEREYGIRPVAYTRLSRDHDHQVGKPRGLLCFYHNKRLVGNRSTEEIAAVHAYFERAALFPQLEDL